MGTAPPAPGTQVCAGVPRSRRGCRSQGHIVHSSAVGPARPERSSPQSSLCAQAPAATVTLLRPLLSHCGGAARPCLPSAWGRVGGESGESGEGSVTWAISLPGPTRFLLRLGLDQLRLYDVSGLEGALRSCLAFASDLLHDLDQIPFPASGPQFPHLFHKAARIISPDNEGKAARVP